MKTRVLCAAAVLALPLALPPAFADSLVARDGGNLVRLIDGPCQSEQILTKLLPHMQGQFKAASVVLQGETFSACWRVQGNAAHLLYEDGDQGLIPLADLKPELTV